MTTEQIKARIYDLLVLIEQAKAEINLLQEQLNKLSKEAETLENQDNV